MLNDIYGPTAEIPEIEALVVSKETGTGAGSINKYRREEKKFPELEIYTVDLIGCEEGNEENNWIDKLSSTALRKKELEHMHS